MELFSFKVSWNFNIGERTTRKRMERIKLLHFFILVIKKDIIFTRAIYVDGAIYFPTPLPT
jgi:hypothetical protein